MSELRLVAVGKTGVGKSSFGNTVLNNRRLFHSSCGGCSVTTMCQFEERMVNGRHISMIDTPGLKDTEIEDKDNVMNEITRCIFLSAPGPHAICFTAQIGRFTQEDIDTIKEFVGHFGEALYKYAIIVFTRYDDYKRECDDNDKGCNINDYISTLPPAIKEFVVEKCGSRAIGFDNTLRGPNSQIQVEELFVMVDKMVAQNGREYYSNVNFKKSEEIFQAEMYVEKGRLEQEMEDKMEKFRIQINEATDKKIMRTLEEERMTEKARMVEEMDAINLRKFVRKAEWAFEKFKKVVPVVVSVVEFLGAAAILYETVKGHETASCKEPLLSKKLKDDMLNQKD